MKIFITGISSEIMKGLVALIDLSKHEVIGLSRKSILDVPTGIKIVKGDILTIEHWENYLIKSDLLIHAAAITHSYKDSDYYSVNFEATKKLIDFGNRYQIKKIVFISSNASGLGNGTYGITKYLAEKYIVENFNNYLIFKLSEVYGSQKKEGIETLINDVLNKSIVFCPQDIPSKFYPIHIKDTIRLIHENIFITEKKNQILVLNGPLGFTFLEIIELVQRISKRNVRVVFLNKKLMFLFKKLVKWIPFNIGIVPDQVDRLYGVKDFNIPSETNFIKLESYLENISI